MSIESELNDLVNHLKICIISNDIDRNDVFDKFPIISKDHNVKSPIRNVFLLYRKNFNNFHLPKTDQYELLHFLRVFRNTLNFPDESKPLINELLKKQAPDYKDQFYSNRIILISEANKDTFFKILLSINLNYFLQKIPKLYDLLSLCHTKNYSYGSIKIDSSEFFGYKLRNPKTKYIPAYPLSHGYRTMPGAFYAVTRAPGIDPDSDTTDPGTNKSRYFSKNIIKIKDIIIEYNKKTNSNLSIHKSLSNKEIFIFGQKYLDFQYLPGILSSYLNLEIISVSGTLTLSPKKPRYKPNYSNILGETIRIAPSYIQEIVEDCNLKNQDNFQLSKEITDMTNYIYTESVKSLRCDLRTRFNSDKTLISGDQLNDHEIKHICNFSIAPSLLPLLLNRNLKDNLSILSNQKRLIIQISRSSESTSFGMGYLNDKGQPVMTVFTGF